MAEAIRIPLRRRDGTVRAYTLIDEIDAGQATHRWYLHNIGYAYRELRGFSPRRTVLLHREIAGLVPGDGREVDHLNRDRLDNRRVNLRVVTHAENQQNMSSHRGSASKYRGVSWQSDRQRWLAQATINGRTHNLGRFANEDTAGEAVRQWRLSNMPFTVEAKS